MSLIRDYVDQLQEFKKMMNQVQVIEEREFILPMITDDIVDEDGVSTATHFTMQSWLLYKKRNLLKMKDQHETKNREQENRKKMLMRDALCSSSRQKIQKLRSRKYFLSGQVDYVQGAKKF